MIIDLPSTHSAYRSLPDQSRTLSVRDCFVEGAKAKGSSANSMADGESFGPDASVVSMRGWEK